MGLGTVVLESFLQMCVVYLEYLFGLLDDVRYTTTRLVGTNVKAVVILQLCFELL
jgi:hypothetical protein